MSTSSEERRRTEAALVRAIDANPDITTPSTRAAVCEFVDVLLDEGLRPESALIAFKAAIMRAEALYRFEQEAREQLRSALVSACIRHYFTGRPADEVRLATRSPLRLVRDEETDGRRAPGAST